MADKLPRWPGAEVAIIASGPSLTSAQCNDVRAWRARGEARRAIVINTSFRLAPWADVLYACDAQWWDLYAWEVSTAFAGDCWSQDIAAQDRYGVHYVQSQRGDGLCKRKSPPLVFQGGNSGYQAINFAYLAGATRLILLGFDMQRVDGASHWHGDHPPGLDKRSPFPTWVQNFARLATDLQSEGVEVVNCSPMTALECFPKAPLDSALDPVVTTAAEESLG